MKIKNILIIRFSAMGDVAMLVPLVHSLAVQYPHLHITLLTRKHLTPFYDWMPANVETIGVDLKQYKGIGGLNRLYKELKNKGFDAVADMHDVLRSKFLRLRFRMSGVRCVSIDKGRKEKKRLIGHGMQSGQLTPMVQRYADVVVKLGLSVKLDYSSAFDKAKEDISPLASVIPPKREKEKWVGIAPFAAHENKIYPLDKMKAVVKTIAEHKSVRVFLFGAGKKEKEVLEGWESERVMSVCGKLGGLHNEMLLMSQLDVMLAMDSANMHIASLVGTPVVSIWGATHPKAGFLPWNQPADNILQVDDLPCRPCSVYGNKPCQFGDLRCMNRIKPDSIINKLGKYF